MRKNFDYLRAKEALIHSEIAHLLDNPEDAAPVVGFHGGLVNPVEFKKWQLKALERIKKEPLALTGLRFAIAHKRLCPGCKKMFNQGVIVCSKDFKRFVFARMARQAVAE